MSFTRLLSGNQSSQRKRPFLDVLRACSGYYECPMDADGKRKGPLVGYAGKDEKGKQYVGDVYLNAAALEQYPLVLKQSAQFLLREILDAGIKALHGSYWRDEVTFCGAPMGGLALANMLAEEGMGRYIYPEKEIIALATESSREQSRLAFKRHEVHEGEKVVIVEDVCNNFSTTGELAGLIESLGGSVTAITCLVNRSLTIRTQYDHKTDFRSDPRIPIFSILDKPIPQFRQEDPVVAEDIAKGNVVWKPKNEWARLMEAMNANRATV